MDDEEEDIQRLSKFD